MSGIVSRKSDILLAVFVLAIAAMLLIPLPTPLLDFLLALNIAAAILLLLAGLYMPNALAMLSFPAMLLLTTLFRLALNVASTRLILSQGNAGQVIEAFGTFLIRGEVVVGVIIFLIITIVNFIVIARGSSRVSEVAARFALDALPGKQMAIDADVRAGIITPEQAQIRRDDLRKESQLYGSMDGAMKFVQGDAIAGFFIILTNIVGGIYLGVSGGMSFSEAVGRYTILTVGDGLVSQIPALLISICAGIVVTRVSSGDDTTLGADLGAQLFARPGTLFAAGVILMVVGLLPGLPWIPFFSVGLLFSGSAFVVQRMGGVSAPSRSGGLTTLLPVPKLQGNAALQIEDESGTDSRLEILLDSQILFRVYQQNKQFYRSWWQEFSQDFQAETGVSLPALKVTSDDLSPASHYSIRLSGTVIDAGSILLDSVLVEMNPDLAEVLGIEVAVEAEHPIGKSRVFWAMQSPSLRRIVDGAKIRSFDFLQFIGLKVAEFVRLAPEEVFNLSDVHALLRQLEKKNPGIVQEAMDKDFMNLSRLTELLQALVREGVSIKDFPHILESIAAYCSTYGLSMVQEKDFNLQDIVSFVRVNRKRQLISHFLSERRTLKIFTLSDGVQGAFEGASSGTWGLASASLGLEPEIFQKLRDGLRSLCEPLRSRGLLPVVVLCHADVRHRVSNFVRNAESALGVVTFDELEPGILLEPAGEWVI